MKKTILIIIALLLLYIFVFNVLKVNDGRAIFMINFRGINLPSPRP